jgi:hypothetical protein
MNVEPPKNSTNVRFVIFWVSVASANAGCTAFPPHGTPRPSCGAGLRAVCGTVGAERSCECVPQTEIERFLRTFGQPAALGGAY